MVPIDDVRTCATCACYAMVAKDGTIHGAEATEGSPMCRRFAPIVQQIQQPGPMLDGRGMPLMGKDGKPRMGMVNAIQCSYQPTLPQAVCFDGWRPLGTKPGEPPPALHDFRRLS